MLTKPEWELYLYFLRVGESTVVACHQHRLESRPDLHYMITYTQLARAAKKGWLAVRQGAGALLYYRALPLEAGVQWLLEEYMSALTPRRSAALLRRAIDAATKYLSSLETESVGSPRTPGDLDPVG